MKEFLFWLLIAAACLLALNFTPAFAGDRPDLDEHVPKSCRELYHWQEKCRLGPCNPQKIEHWRAQCKKDSTVERQPP